MPRIYSGTDRLNAMNKALINFLDKVSFCTYLRIRCTPWRNDSAIWKSTAASRAWTMRSAWCAFSKTTNKLKSNSVLPTYPVLTWPGREVCVYFHPCLRYLSGTGWEICSKPAQRDLSDRQKKRFATNFERFDDVERRTMQDLISSYRAGLDWSTNDLEKLPLPSETRPRFRLLCRPCARTSEREAEKYTFYYHASHFISHILFFKKAQWSDVIVCHEFCMNAFDHVFGKILGKMQLTVKLEGGVLGKMGSSKQRYSGFLSPLMRWNGLLSVCEKTNTEFRWMAKTSFWISW